MNPKQKSVKRIITEEQKLKMQEGKRKAKLMPPKDRIGKRMNQEDMKKLSPEDLQKHILLIGIRKGKPILNIAKVSVSETKSCK